MKVYVTIQAQIYTFMCRYMRSLYKCICMCIHVFPIKTYMHVYTCISYKDVYACVCMCLCSQIAKVVCVHVYIHLFNNCITPILVKAYWQARYIHMHEWKRILAHTWWGIVPQYELWTMPENLKIKPTIIFLEWCNSTQGSTIVSSTLIPYKISSRCKA